MKQNTKAKIKEVMLEQVNPLVTKMVGITVLEREIVRLQKELEGTKAMLAAEVAAKESDFQSLIELMTLCDMHIRQQDSNTHLFDVLNVKRTEESQECASRLMREIANRMEELHVQGLEM